MQELRDDTDTRRAARTLTRFINDFYGSYGTKDSQAPDSNPSSSTPSG